MAGLGVQNSYSVDATAVVHWNLKPWTHTLALTEEKMMSTATEFRRPPCSTPDTKCQAASTREQPNAVLLQFVPLLSMH